MGPNWAILLSSIRDVLVGQTYAADDAWHDDTAAYFSKAKELLLEAEAIHHSYLEAKGNPEAEMLESSKWIQYFLRMLMLI